MFNWNFWEVLYWDEPAPLQCICYWRICERLAASFPELEPQSSQLNYVKDPNHLNSNITLKDRIRSAFCFGRKKFCCEKLLVNSEVTEERKIKLSMTNKQMYQLSKCCITWSSECQLITKHLAERCCPNTPSTRSFFVSENNGRIRTHATHENIVYLLRTLRNFWFSPQHTPAAGSH